MAGIADVARSAGVSKSTASRALTGSGYVSDETRARVRAAASALGYVPTMWAVSLATGRTNTVGVMVPSLDRWFFASVVEGIQSALLTDGYDLVLCCAPPGSDSRRRMFAHSLARKRFDGLIAVGVEPDETEREQLAAFARPIVSVGHDGGAMSISIDDRAAARIATEHLLGLGHTDVVILGGDPDGRRTSVGDGERLLGYRSAMTDAGLGAAARHIPCEVSLPGGYGAAVEMLADRRTRPSALVGVCDEVAVGAMIAARRLGVRVPEHLSVVGIDDHSYADMFALTTLQQRPDEQGRTAARLLLDMLAGEVAPPRHLLEAPRLVVRNSTAAVSDAASAIVGASRRRT
ncbi:DNA-binding LacI/PurR family transcriptional regulator [Microbacterium terrae]|uniref:HTH-type transcriptional regulator DegA n=1 Tax=Microbacterium terrae TaxID=69369 RepID=A0A0M2GVG6_9MICO|nr:LacI family DNA-binding transcriptional regulator [Microbacterium terrae]KJL37661.1 HTH-type transcriptional regulator DegA [Microbacterium terrae]MBP1076493.1 DNA-binding LacI/PurR family transcriptional regulator [Microbacterium terrae]GLJ97322.1 LacI family transcriptional regulator [Microbacterium terrae]